LWRETAPQVDPKRQTARKKKIALHLVQNFLLIVAADYDKLLTTGCPLSVGLPMFRSIVLVWFVGFSTIYPSVSFSDVGFDPIPGVVAEQPAEKHEDWIRQSDMNLTRRATGLGKWEGDASASLGSGAPGGFSATPGVTGRLGLGYGLTAELSAFGSSIRPDSYRPGAGLKWQFLGDARSKFSAAVMGLYRPEGFNTPEGEVEVHLLGAYRSGRSELLLNLTAGGDPDGAEQDLEAHLGGGYHITGEFVVGGELQSRASLGTKLEKSGVQEHIIGPSVQYRFGKFLLSGLAGAGAIQLQHGSPLEVGGYGMARLGYHF